MTDPIALTTYANPTLGISLRVIEIDGTPFFSATDICKTVGLRPTPHGSFRHRFRRLPQGDLYAASDMGVRLPGSGQSNASIVSEDGLRWLIARSDKPEADAFRDWMDREVIPTVRLKCAYMACLDKVAEGEMTFEGMTRDLMESLREQAQHLPPG